MRVAVLAGPCFLALLLCCRAAPTRRPSAVSHVGPTRTFRSPAELSKAVQRRNDAYRTLKSVHRVTIQLADGHGKKTSLSCRGVVAVKRPASYRLVAVDSIGTRLFELRYDNGAVAVEANDSLQRPSLVEVLRSVAEDIRAIYRLDPRPTFDHSKLEEGVTSSGHTPLVQLLQKRRGKLVRQLTVFSATLAVARTEIFGPQDTLTITYGDYEDWGEALLPRRIHVARDGQRSYWISIQVTSLQINPELDDRLFRSATNS